MATVFSETERIVDEKGSTIREITEQKVLHKDTEPDYIKIYTKMWFEFKQFPKAYCDLFIQLAIRMSYCNSYNLEDSQTVCVIGAVREAIAIACGWDKKSSQLRKGLNALCDCGAIRRTSRGCYQINPEYAGKGSWHYNPKEQNGGIKDLRTAFNFADKTVETIITYNGDDDCNGDGGDDE